MVVGGGRKREREEIGVPDRTKEEEPGLNLCFHLHDPFQSIVGTKPRCSGGLSNV